MKITFPKYGLGELLINKLDAPSIIWSMMIGFFAGLYGSYLLKNHFWLLMIAALSVVSIVLCFGAAMRILLNWRKSDEAPSTGIKENGPRITSQWDYRPRKAIRVRVALDRPNAETSAVPSPDPFMTNNNVWFNDDSLDDAAPTFVNIQPNAEELITKVLSETTDTICAAPVARDAAVSR
jgi:hypothetical protein